MNYTLRSSAALLSFMVLSCANHDNNQYDTEPAAKPTSVSQATTAQTSASNPVYDSPAAYEENSTTAEPQQALPPIDEPSASPSPSRPTAHHSANTTPPARPINENGAAIIHTVVAGDTLGGIARKYKVTIASIKQANRMTNDTVVLGKKMVIPPQ